MYNKNGIQQDLFFLFPLTKSSELHVGSNPNKDEKLLKHGQQGKSMKNQLRNTNKKLELRLLFRQVGRRLEAEPTITGGLGTSAQRKQS